MVGRDGVNSAELGGFEISSEVYSLGLGVFVLGSGYIWDNAIVVWPIGFVGGRLEP